MVAAALVLGACGGGVSQDADLVAGKEAFIERCGSCHVLERAGTQGKAGPSLDAAFARALIDGFNRRGVAGVVLEQIDKPARLPPDHPAYMPPDLVTGQMAENVAAYVAYATSRPGEDQGVLAEAGQSDFPPGSGGAVFADGTQQAQACGQCHTLSEAGTQATIGPSLDEALQGESPEEIRRDIVEPDAEIAQGFAAGVMPSNYEQTLSEEELNRLVEFLAEVSGGGGGGQGG
ncbi:MAG TPA: c-type cytochrome [Solirubrobacteraceae bacterium]|nr:c-type cytochrome [Solirubrobacteraceae bacterium]